VKEPKICLCPESIKWIQKHLLKSARAKFQQLLKKGSIKNIKRKKKRSKKQLANDKRLGRMAKARAKKRRR
tara:strand:+ start:694 stop:906 length:213 start_codon:yes stop_codon:yes gene_type:complete